MYQRPLFAAFLLSTENCMTSSPLAGYVDLANTTVAGFTGIHCKPGGSAAMMALVLEHCPDTRSPAPQDACARPHVPKRKRALKGASVKTVGARSTPGKVQSAGSRTARAAAQFKKNTMLAAAHKA